MQKEQDGENNVQESIKDYFFGQFSTSFGQGYFPKDSDNKVKY